MPTGYTSDLYDGKDVSFQDFALKCARAFGALVEMREDALDAKIPDEFKPSSHYQDSIKKARKRLEVVQAWSDAEAERMAAKQHASELSEWMKSREQTERRLKRYRAMLAEVRAWVPPTEDHEGLKKFMVEQLESSIKFDCGYSWPRPVAISGKTFRAREEDKANNDLAYYTTEHAKEIQRTNDRNAWVRALRDSLAVRS